MSSFFDYVGADMTAEGGDKRQKKPQGVIERLERDIEDGRPFRSISQADMRALIAVAKAAMEAAPGFECCCRPNDSVTCDGCALGLALAELEGR
jgi:hypothetical protein